MSKNRVIRLERSIKNKYINIIEVAERFWVKNFILYNFKKFVMSVIIRNNLAFIMIF